MELVSLASRIATLAAEQPDTPVAWVVHTDGPDEELTWAQLHRRSSQLAGALAERGLGYGDRLGLALHNSAQLVLATMAAWKLGAVPVPMRWDLPDWEFDRLRAVVDAAVYLAEADLEWIDATAAREVPELPDVLSPHCNGICSSGSTGLPKVIISNQPAVYDELLTTPMAAAWGREIPRPQVVIVLGPMYHVNGFHGILNLVSGDHLVVMERFDAAKVVGAIERYRASMFNCTPTMLKRIADLPGIDDRDLSSIVWFTQGAAPMPPYLVHRWIELTGPDVIHMAYGMTERLGIFAIRGDEWLHHEGSVGRPTRDTEVRILDADGNEVPTREVGEIFLRSAAYGGSTYLGPVPQMRTTPDGFASVGDLGYVDEDGYLYLVDRRVDLIITGGANVYPAEIESALMEHPKVADVVVVGLKDEEWGRRVHAIIQPTDPADAPTLEEIRTYAKSKLHPFKVPKSVEIVDAIPRSAATKVNRGALVEERGG